MEVIISFVVDKESAAPTVSVLATGGSFEVSRVEIQKIEWNKAQLVFKAGGIHVSLDEPGQQDE